MTVLKRLKEAQSQGKSTLKILFSNEIEFVSDKSSLGAGKKRKLVFSNGHSDRESISAQGFLKNSLLVTVAQGLPNTSRKYSKV